MIKKQTFIQGAMIIAVSRVIVKIVGAIYKIPLDRFILGTEGMAMYSASYTIYNWLVVISTVGIPVAISKLVSEQLAFNNYGSARRVLRVSQNLLIVVGFVGFLLMFAGAPLFSNLISAPSAMLAIMALAPSLLFVSVNSAYRGFYQGMQNMYPTAISEIIESVVKLILGLTLAYTLKFAMDGSLVYGAMGGILGVTLSCVASFIFLYIYNKRHLKTVPKTNESKKDIEPAKAILVKIVKIAVPITIGASAFNLTALIDTSMVMYQLSNLGYLESERLTMYGYLNRAITMYNLPLTLIAAIAITIVPTIASSVAEGEIDKARESVKMSLKIALIAAVPCAFGLSSLAQPILSLIYADGNYSELLTVMGIVVIFATIVQVSGSILQAYGRVWDPVKHLLIGGTVKIIVNIILVSNPSINIYGAPFGTLLCHLTIMSLNIYKIKKISKTQLSIKDFVVKPMISGLVVAFTAVIMYNLSSSLGNTVAIMISIMVTAVAYVLALVLTKSIKREELKFFPKGDKLERVIGRFL